MRPLQCVLGAFFLLFILDVTRCDLKEFIINLPSEFGSAVSSAWKNLITAIKKPVRVRRIRRGKQRKTTTIPTTTEYDDIFKNIPIMPKTLEYVQNSSKIPIFMNYNPKIPVLKHPEWNPMLDWRSIQRPTLVQIIKDITEKRRSTTSPEVVIEDLAIQSQRNDEENDNGNFEQNPNPPTPTSTTIILKKPGKPKIPIMETPKSKFENKWRYMPLKQENVKILNATKRAVPVILPNETTTSTEKGEIISDGSSTDAGSLLKVIKLGKYRINIFYKWFFI